MDVAKLKEQIMADSKTDLTGVDISQIQIGMWDLTDFEALDECEKFIKTGRRVYHIQTINVPHLIILSGPTRKG
jgi:hypothetical protein